MIKALATIKGYYDYGMFQADADRGDRGACATATPASNSKPRFTKAGATCWSMACARIGWNDDAAEGQHVLLGADPRAVAFAR